MHNCKATKGRAAELLLKDLDGSYEELLECEDCSTELQTLREILRITTRQVEASAPSEEYWNGYHAKLRSKLEDAVAGSDGSHQPRFHSSWRSSWLRRVLSATIRVPVPVGVAVVFALAVAIFFAVQGSMKEPQPPTASVIHVPVEVPVIQEKTVTRVVYRQPSRQPTRQPTERPNSEAAAQGDVSTLAKSQKVNSTTLTGFKPLDEVKLTVIKGGSPDEK
jgi:hypothetical protein